MTPTSARDAVAYVAQLFPGSDWTPEISALFADRLIRVPIDIEQAKAVIGEYRLQHRYKSPDVGALIQRMWAVVPKDAPQRPVDPQVDAGPNGYERDLIQRWRDNPGHPCFARLRSRARSYGILVYCREQWRVWTGQDGPYQEPTP